MCHARKPECTECPVRELCPGLKTDGISQN
ncbi:MAG: hypothetical protein LBO65_00375 [Spirochaetaceae bacterium]|nr:hypothetical protein [Spirochaetaceae bacterium]